MSRERKVCVVPGCTRMGKRKGTLKTGEPTYLTKCSVHNGKGNKVSAAKLTRKYQKLKAKHKSPGKRTCTQCGWFGMCHLHRITPGEEGGRYVIGNVLLLCPNCHAAAHDHGEPNQRQVYDDPIKATPNHEITLGHLHQKRMSERQRARRAQKKRGQAGTEPQPSLSFAL